MWAHSRCSVTVGVLIDFSIWEGLETTASIPWGQTKITLTLPGHHSHEHVGQQKENFMLAIVIGQAFNINIC